MPTPALGRSSPSTKPACGRWKSPSAPRGGRRTPAAKTRTLPPRKRPRIELDQALSDSKRFAELKSLRRKQAGRSARRAADRRAVPQYLEKQVPPELLRQITVQVQRHRKGVQRLSRQGRRPRDDRQRSPQGALRLEGLRRAEDGVGGEQGRRAGCGGRPQGARAAAQRSGPAPGLQELPRDAALPQRAKPGRGDQAVRRARRTDARAVRGGEGARSTPSWRPTTTFRSTSCGRGTTTIRSSRSRPAFSARTSTPSSKSYEKEDISRLCEKFYAGIDLPIDDVIERSDLYERPGKSPHAFCTDIDREGDVRVLANIVPNE